MKTKASRLRHAASALTLIFGSILLVGLAGEAAVRIKHRIFPVQLAPVIVPDVTLGWRARPGYSFQGTVSDHAGVPYPVQIQTDSRGFRRFDPPMAGQPRILFIGDSFTFAKEVSQDQTFWAHTAAEARASVAAYGADGFCSLQQFLILDRYVDEVRPDLVVWQFCYNDFVGNHLGLTRQSQQNRCGILQPFLVDGEIQYFNPNDGPLAGRLRPLHSQFLLAVAHRLDVVMGHATTSEPSIEIAIERAGPQHPGLQEAVQITRAIFEKVVARCGPVPIIAFDVSARVPFDEAFLAITGELGIPVVTTVSQRIADAADRGKTVFAADGGHWNPLGHRMCADALAASVQKALDHRAEEMAAN